MVITEAMVCGLPVISFDCPWGPRSIIKDGEDGFLVKNRNFEIFVEKLCLLMDKRDYRIKIGEAARLSSMRFEAEDIMYKWRRLFLQLVSL